MAQRKGSQSADRVRLGKHRHGRYLASRSCAQVSWWRRRHLRHQPENVTESLQSAEHDSQRGSHEYEFPQEGSGCVHGNRSRRMAAHVRLEQLPSGRGRRAHERSANVRGRALPRRCRLSDVILAGPLSDWIENLERDAEDHYDSCRTSSSRTAGTEGGEHGALKS